MTSSEQGVRRRLERIHEQRAGVPRPQTPRRRRATMSRSSAMTWPHARQRTAATPVVAVGLSPPPGLGITCPRSRAGGHGGGARLRRDSLHGSSGYYRSRPSQVLWANFDAVHGLTVRGSARGDLRLPWPERRRQDDDDRDPRGLPRAQRRRRLRCSVPDPGQADPGTGASGSDSSCRNASGPEPDRARDAVDLFSTPSTRHPDRSEENDRSRRPLTTLRDARIGNPSGGPQRRRTASRSGSSVTPELIFMDEPTTGFDPSARRGRVADDPTVSAIPRQDGLPHHPLHGGGRSASPTESGSCAGASSSQSARSTTSAPDSMRTRSSASASPPASPRTLSPPRCEPRSTWREKSRRSVRPTPSRCSTG